MIRTERQSIKGEDTMMRTSMNTHLKGMIKVVVALAVAGTLGLLSPGPAGAVDLLHNSRDTASPKWQAQGGWGIAGGKYGEFTCSTCHEPNTNPNIKNVRRTIRTRSGENWPGGQPTVTVDFRNVTSMGDDSGGHASSNRICEVCHSQNQFHNFDTANNTGGLSHPSPKAVCTSCHKHNTGFKAACGGCHGNPPTEAVLGGDTGMIGTPRPSNALEPGQVGAHVTHTETRAMVCDTCHYISNGTIKMPNLSNTIDIGFFGFGGKVTSGTYTPYSSLDRGYRIASGTPNSTIAAAVTDYPSANRCANVYCHGGGVKVGQTQVKAPLTGGSNTAPRWDGTGQDQCGSCHGTTAATPPTTGGHVRHAGSTGNSFSCDLCHPAIDVTHVQGSVRWAFKTSDARVGASAAYQAAVAPTATTAGATGDLAPSASFGQCSNLYCHSDGNGGAAYVATPTWGDSLPAGCIGCHGNNAASTNPITSKGHKAHVNNTSSRFGSFNFRCNECHNSVVDSSDRAIINTPLHANAAREVSWGPKSTGGLAYATNGCSQIYCHSNGQGIYKSPPTTWGAITDGQQGTIQCDYCHGGLATNTTPVSSMRHSNHIAAGPLPHRPIQCNWCHSNTVGADGQSVFNGTDVKHINRSIDVSFIKMANFSGSYSTSTRVCANTYCHTNNATTSSRDWDTTTLNTCGNCHEANNTTTTSAKLSDAHRKHYNRSTRPANTTEEGWTNVNLSSTNNVFMCGTCHPANPTSTHINGPPAGVTNGSVAEIVLRLPFTPPAGAGRTETVARGSGVNYDGRGYGYSTGTSCDTYCHSDGRGGPPKNTMSWAVTTTSCGNCHNQYGDNPATTTWSGSHNKHLAGTTSANATCNACHAATAATNTTLIASRRDRHPNGFRNVTGNSFAGAFTWNGTTQQCTNVYCHFSKPVTWGGTLPTGCVGCHGNNAASSDAIVSRGHKAHVNNTSGRFGGFNFRCNECHNTTVDGTDRTLISTTLHANRTADVSWGPKSTGGLAYATNGCTQIYCHSNGQGTYKSPPTTWNAIADGQQGTIQCDYCHGGLATNATPVSSLRHTNHINAGPLPHKPIGCNWCHSNTVGSDGQSVFNGTDVKHINRSIDVSFIKMANFSGSYNSSTHVCANTYCHTNNATTSTRDWDTTTTNTCGNCHEANNTTTTSAKLSDAHRKHYNRSTRPSNTTEEGWTNVNLSSTNNVFMCGTCHPANPTSTHLNGPPAGVTNGSVAEIVLRLSFTTPQGAGRPETVTRGTGVNYDGRGYGYSTGTSCDTYCHSDGRGGPPKNVMQWAVSTTSCGNCHDQASNNPATTTWSAPHNKHANTYGNGGVIGSNNTTTNNTFVTCAGCHASTASSNTALATSQRAKHPNGFRNISASSTVGSAAFRWDAGNNQCKNGYCHSRAYSFTDYSTPWIKWDLTQAVTCGSCHKSYPTGPDYANGYKGKANSHPKHAVFWGFTCDWCHNNTAVYRNNSTVISNYRNHVNKNYNVVANGTKTFIGKANTFTATATTNPPTVKTTCSSVNCHGGNTSKVFVWGGTNKCGDCHFATSDTVNYGFKNGTMAVIARTEWRYSGHGKVSGSYDVTGAAFAGFSAAAANGTSNPGGDPCLYCHEYDSVLHGTTDNPLRLRNFNTGVQAWGKNSVCLVCHATSGATGVQPAAGYILKTATRKVDKYHYGSKHSTSLTGGQFCWDCHDAHGDRASSTDGRPIAMVHKKPAKGSDTVTGMPTFLTTTTVGNFVAKSSAANFSKTTAPYNALCNVCHDYKASDPNKMVHYTATSSDSHNSTQLCTNCHKHSGNTTYDAKAYDSPTDCNACHDYDTRNGGATWGANPISPVNEGFGAHAKHIQYIKARWGITLNPAADTYGNGSAAAVCGVCHSNVLAEHTPGASGNPRSINFGGSAARQFGAAALLYNGNSATSSSVNPKSCSNVDCHYRTSPIWQ